MTLSVPCITARRHVLKTFDKLVKLLPVAEQTKVCHMIPFTKVDHQSSRSTILSDRRLEPEDSGHGESVKYFSTTESWS